MQAKIPDDKKATEYLANERTLLAWVRTSIAILSLGFVIAKFGVWLREMSTRIGAKASAPGIGASLPIGVAIMLFGGVIAMLAAWRFRQVNEAIKDGSVQVDHRLATVITLGMGAVVLGLIAYIVLTVGHDA